MSTCRKKSRCRPRWAATSIPGWERWLCVRNDPVCGRVGQGRAFKLKNLPAGKDLEFQLWQEKVGFLKDVEVKGSRSTARAGSSSSSTPDEDRKLEFKVDRSNESDRSRAATQSGRHRDEWRSYRVSDMLIARKLHYQHSFHRMKQLRMFSAELSWHVARPCCPLCWGCGRRPTPPRFRLNRCEIARTKLPARSAASIADVLYAMFGTPDKPYVLPEAGWT